MTCFASLAFFLPLQVAIWVLANNGGSNGFVSCPVGGVCMGTRLAIAGTKAIIPGTWVKYGLCMKALFASHTPSDQIEVGVGLGMRLQN